MNVNKPWEEQFISQKTVPRPLPIGMGTHGNGLRSELSDKNCSGTQCFCFKTLNAPGICSCVLPAALPAATAAAAASATAATGATASAAASATAVTDATAAAATLLAHQTITATATAMVNFPFKRTKNLRGV